MTFIIKKFQELESNSTITTNMSLMLDTRSELSMRLASTKSYTTNNQKLTSVDNEYGDGTTKRTADINQMIMEEYNSPIDKDQLDSTPKGES